MIHGSAWPEKRRSSTELRERLLRFERESKLDLYRQNLFDEGPHLTSSSALPWGDEVREFVHEAYLRFMHGENWHTGKGGRQMEREVISMMGEMFHNPDAVGVITSGGTESNLVGLVTARVVAFLKEYPEVRGATFHSLREYARVFEWLDAFNSRQRSVVMPSHAHYSFYKGCAMLGFRPVPVPPREGTLCDVDLEALRAAVSDDTIAIVGTAGTWPFGTIDPIEQMGEIAEEKNVYMHVDACFGGFIIPFLDRVGYYGETLPPWDFRIPAVQTMTADAHKNGMVPKPASTVYFRSKELRQVARLMMPPDGVIAGSRGTGPMAATWAMMQSLGLEGYTEVSRHSIRLRDQLIEGIESIPGMGVVPGSKINLITAYSKERDLRPVVNALADLNWQIVTHEKPEPIALCICTMPQNDGQVDAFVADLRRCVERHAVPIGTLPDDYELKPYGLDRE